MLGGSEHESISLSHVLDWPSAQCPVSVLSHSVGSCGTCLRRPGIVFHTILFKYTKNLKKTTFNSKKIDAEVKYIFEYLYIYKSGMFSYIGGWKGGRQNGNGIIKFNSGEWISKEKLVVTALLNSDDISYKVSRGRKLRERIQKKRKSSLVFRKLFSRNSLFYL